MRRLIHYSAQPLTEVKTWQQVTDMDRMKPRGLWVSCEGEMDWLEWCQSEQFGLSSFKHATEVVLKPEAHIMVLTTPEEIDAFSETYAYDALADRCPSSVIREGMWCHWEALAKVYQGLIIEPYIWERRLTPHTMWYYGWDCASGCIWDGDAVQELRVLPAPVIKNEDQEQAA